MNQRKYQPRRSRITAAIISFFLGAVGGQKFYLRQTGLAIFMVMALIFTNGFTMPFFAIFGVFEAIKFLNMSDQEFDRRHNRYSSSNRRDDYLANRKDRQVKRGRGNLPAQRRRQNPSRSSVQKANPFKNSGIKKYKDYDLEGAILDFAQGLDINPQDVALHFNIACAYSMTEEKEKAYHHLSKAVELGFKDFEMIKTKDDLAFLRIQPEYDSFKENGYQLTGNMHQATKSAQGSNNTVQKEEITDDVLLSQLNKLAQLRTKGLLSQEEFSLERKKLLRR
ncbi:MAG: NINE protein [Saprospiraceae bacterium]